MPVKSMTPYLFFEGQAEAAIEHYQQALKAEVEGLMRWGDQPGGCPDGLKGRVMHAALKIGQASLMLSDSPKGGPSRQERADSIAVRFDDAGEMKTCFDALADGGTVVERVHDAFWGEKFGVVRDRFGVTWMFTCASDDD